MFKSVARHSTIILSVALLALSTSRCFADPVPLPTIIGGGSPQPIGPAVVYAAVLPVVVAAM